MANEAEEFEFRARAEREAQMSAPAPQENSAGAASQQPTSEAIGLANRQAEASERGPVGDTLAMVGAIPGGVAETAGNIGTAVQHPIDTVAALLKKIPGAGKIVMDALADPKAAAQKVGQIVQGITPEKMGNLIGSTAAGGAAGKAAGVLGDVVGPSVKALQKPVSQTVRDLAGKNVVTTPGQRGGKMLGALEEKLTSDPVAGESIRTARGKATEQWNRSELDDAIKDAGGTPLPKNRTGRDAIYHAKQQMSDAYAKLLPKMQGSLSSADTKGVSFRQAITDRVAAARKLDPDHSKLIHDIIDDEVVAKFKQSGGYTKGDTIKEIQETLRTESEDLRRGSYQDRQAGKVIDGIRQDFSAMLKRENPKLAADLDKLDRGYSKYDTIRRASQYSKTGTGTFTPAQKLRAIAAKDKSKGKDRFATGRAHGQKETEAVEKVLGNTQPDSGTAGRVAALDAIKHPIKALQSGALSAAYSQPVLRYLQNRALRRGQPYKPGTGRKPATVGAVLGARDE